MDRVNIYNKVFELTKDKKLLISFSPPKKSGCYECMLMDRYNKVKKKSYPAKQVEYVIYRNFRYENRYPKKIKFEDKIVPVVFDSWEFITGGHIIFCENCKLDIDYYAYRYFWIFRHENGGSDYANFTEAYLKKSIPSIYRSIKEFIKDLPIEKGREVKKDWVEQG